jgi:uncharacterized membrane protein
MSPVLHRNINALLEVRRREEQMRSAGDRIADAITRFAGSMWCIWTHAILFGAWIVVNVAPVPGVRRWDPFPFVMLAVITSVEAIFLSTFILITQNRMSKIAERRAEMDLQISLLTEHELTRVAQILESVAARLDAPRPPEHEMAEIRSDINPQRVAEEIERVSGGAP